MTKMTHEAELMFSRIINLAIENFDDGNGSTYPAYLSAAVESAFTDAVTQFEEEQEKIDELSQNYNITPKFGMNSQLRAAINNVTNIRRTDNDDTTPAA
jgi:hypothetical protein